MGSPISQHIKKCAKHSSMHYHISHLAMPKAGPNQHCFDPPLDAYIYTHLLKSCSKKKDLGSGRRIHIDVCKLGLIQSDVFVGSAVIDMYAKCGFLCEARQVSRKLRVRNVVTWNALIGGFVNIGDGREALISLRDMELDHIRPDVVTYTFSLKACGLGLLSEKGREIHCEIAKMGLLEGDPFLGSALVGMYVDCGLFAEAHGLFVLLNIRDVVTWNTLISGYVQQEHFEEALKVYDRMDVSPNVITYACILKACGCIGAAVKGSEIHAEVAEKGLLKSCSCPFLGNMLVEMYAKFGIMSKVQEVFDSLPFRTVGTWTSLMGGYSQNLLSERVMECWEQMKMEGIALDVMAYACLLKTCGNIKRLNKGIELHKEVSKNGLLKKDLFLGTGVVNMYIKCGSLREAHEAFDTLPVHDTVMWNSIIGGYVQENQGWCALKLFEEMKIEGVATDSITLCCCLNACGGVENIEWGRDIHVEILMKGFETDVFLGSALVDMYVKWESLAEAHVVFYSIPFRDLVTWNALLAGYAKSGHFEEAVNAFQVMRQEGLCPDSITIACYVKACGCTYDIAKGIGMHAEIYENNMLSMDSSIVSALMCMYSNFGQLAKVAEVFDKHPVRDVATWNTLISAYIQHDRGEHALLSFEEMKRQGVSPDPITFSCCLKACGSIGAVEKGAELHGDISEEGFSDCFLGIALVNMYAKFGMLLKAWEALDALPIHTVVSWTAFVSGCVQHEFNEEALDCFKQMEVLDIPPDAVTFACELRACNSLGAVEKGIVIHGQITAMGLLNKNLYLGNMLVHLYAKHGLLVKAQEVFNALPSRDTSTWAALLEGYVRNKCTENALDCMDKMRAEGITPNSLSCIWSLKACVDSGDVNKGSLIHRELCKMNLLKDAFVGCAVVDMYAKCGLLVEALEVFESLAARNAIAWNALISGFARLGKAKEAFDLFECMEFEGVKPDQATFASILKACSHAGDVIKGLTYFEAMNESYRITPGLNHHTCMVDLLGRAGQLGEAGEMMNNAPFHPDSVMALALLSACRKWGEIDLAMNVFEHAVGSDEKLASAYICMYNIYADAML